MKYRVFNTQQEAIAAEKEICKQLGYSKPGINAATGEIVEDALTTSWAEVFQIEDGRWIFLSPDNQGEEEQASWFPEPVESLFHKSSN